MKSEDSAKKLLMVLVTLVFLGIILFAVSFFFYDITHNKRQIQITFECEELTEFFRVQGDKKIPVTLPADLKTQKGETVVLETVLPDVIADDTWICYDSGKSTKIYIGDELRKDFDKNQGTIIGGAVKGVHIFIGLQPSDAGKTLRLVRDGNDTNGSNIRPLYIGTSLGIIERIVRSNIFFFILTIALLIISIIAVIIGLVLRFSRKLNSPITSMGLGVLFVTLWLIFDSELFQIVFRTQYIDGTMSFIMMLMLPYPFLYYLDSLQEHRYRLIFAYLALFLEIVTISACLLHFSGTLDFLSMLPFLAVSEGIVIAFCIVSMAMDCAKGYYRSYLVSFIGISGFALSGIIELILVLTVDDRYDGSSIIFGLFWTITFAILHQLYAVREAQKEAAVAVRASETKTNFLANMSHEIRTPMNAILGMDEMILREAKGNEKIIKYATDIRSAGNMLLSIINDILDLSKIESGKAELIPVDFEICSVINDLINIVKKRADEKELQFSFDAAEDIPIRFHGDEIRVRQVMLNIMNNAVKYTSAGSVSASLRIDKNVKGMIPTDNMRSGEGSGSTESGVTAKNGEAVKSGDTLKTGDTVTLVVTVKDTGIGIKDEDKEKLFTPFDRLEQTKNRNIEGTGLGLNIAGNYVALMGGRIDVDSVYGEGSTFTVYLPMTVVDPTPIGDFTERVKELRVNGDDYRPMVIAPNASALIVDDNEMNLEVISGLMESTRIRVDVALSGPEGITKMEKKRYDIVFLDQMMPGMDGVTTLKLMRAKFDMRNVSVIALTADAVTGAREFYLEKGFDDYISKPVKAEALESVLSNHLPARLLLTKEDIDRIVAAEEKKKSPGDSPGATGTGPEKTMLVIDPDSEALKDVKARTEGAYKGTFVNSMDKAAKFLEKHDTDYVMVRRDIFEETLKRGNKE